MNKNLYPALVAFLVLFFSTQVRAQNPLNATNGFSVFVKNNLSLGTTNVSKAVAAGGNFKVGGTIGSSSAGTYTVGSTTAALVVGGSLDWSGGNTTISNGYAKIGNCTGTTVWYADPLTSSSVVQINQGPNYSSCCPWIQFNGHTAASFGGVSASSNPVCASTGINFNTDFTQLEANATAMAGNSTNVTLYRSGLTLSLLSLVGLWVPTNQVDITLASGVNFLNLTGAQLNALQNLNITNAIDATHTLIINVDASGTFNWTVPTISGSVNSTNLLYNFYNTTTLNLTTGQTIKGTLFAPKADVNITVNKDIQGQVVAKSFTGLSGNILGNSFANSSIPGLSGLSASIAAGFSINDNTQCTAGNAFLFANTSTGAGTLSYLWDFGDGTTSNSASPSKTYAAAGTYAVKLIVTDSTGIKDSLTNTVTVNAQPSAAFSVNALAQVLIGNSFNFTATSQIAGSTYLWTLGDGTTSASATVTGKTYLAAGSYTVKLVVTNANGCKDSSTQVVTIGLNPTVALPGVNLPTQCLVGNSFVFTNASIGVLPITYHWDFGDGTTSAALLPVKVYAAAGVYNVKLVVTNGLGVKDSSIVTVNVNAQPLPLFSVNASTQVLVSNSFNLAATAQVAGNLYLWNFGDGTTDTTASVNGHVYAAPGTYLVKLVVTTPNGCKDSSTQFVVVLPNAPTVSASVNLSAQCLVGNSFVFANASVGTGLLSYLWDFGDGTTSTLLSPTKVYAAAGVYPVKLVVTDINGLKDSILLSATVHAQPLPTFTVNASAQLFIGNSFNVAAIAQLAGNVYLWDFGDGTTATTASVIGHVYAAPGTYNVKLRITTANGCIDSSTQMITVSANATVALPGIGLPTQCLLGNSFVFTNASVGIPPLSYFWDFGDGTTSNLLLPIKVYAAAGIYNVKLVVTSGLGVKDSSIVTVNVNAQPLPLFTVNASTQVLVSNSFNLSAAVQVAGNLYLWNFGDGTTDTTASVTGHVYAAPGTYNVKLVVTNANGCKDSSTQVVIVLPNAPTVSASVNLSAQCLVGNSFVFANASVGTGLLSYLWDFGDGTTSTLAAPIKVYAAAGVYPVKLVVADINGLKDSLTLNVTVHAQPLPTFTVNASAQLFIGNSLNVSAIAQLAGNVYLWDFGDGTTATTASVNGHVYAAPGTYNVKLRIMTANGCTDSSTQVVVITTNPLPVVSASVNLNAQCLVGNSFVFANASIGLTSLNYLWDFGDGTTSTLLAPIKVYAAAGVYNVKLIATDLFGSKDSVTLTVTVHPQPLPSFTVNASTQVLLGNNFNFAATAQVAGNVYLWDFGDGTTANTASVTGKAYTAAGTYNVKLVVTSANGCKDSSTGIVIIIQNPPVAPTSSFMVNNAAQCLNNNTFVFTSTSTGNNLTYNWAFGDGMSSTVANPTHTYASAGSYTVTLTVTNAGGSSSSQQTVTVYPAAMAGFTVSPTATQYLTGNSFLFTSSNPQAGNSYDWNLGDGTTANTVSVTHSYTAAGPYTVRQIVTNSNGCKDTAYQDVTVLSDSVGSGNNGGLESDGLGGLVTRRNFNRLKYSLNGTFNVLNAPVFDVPLYASKGAAAVQELSDMMPANLAAGDVPRISTPTDLTALTIAKEALSVDYTRRNVTKASVLGIQTEGRAYNHTKSICDRFKGGTILNIQQTSVRGFDFSRYAIRQANGMVEYAIAFAAGKKTGEQSYRLQTGWVISRYAKDDTVYNFQVWATAPADADKLAGDILDKLSAVRPLSVVRSADNLPAAYITKGVRHKDTLLLTLRNTTGIANGQVSFEERTNELAGQQNRILPVTYKANGDAVVAVPIGDGYEYEGLLYLGDSLVDQVYLADGNWGLDYDQSLTSVKVYEPSNNPTRIYTDEELPVYRSVTLTAVSDDYITLYKALLPGTEPLDLTEYHTLKFHATGNGNVIIRMSRDSITSWNAQYKTTTMLVQEGKDYEIAFEDFVSDKLPAPFYPKDVKTLDFTMLADGKKAQFDLKLENVAFAKKKSASLLALQSKTLSIAPNPIKGPFTVTYASDAARSLTLSVSDISGRVLYSQSVNAVVGTNTLTVNLTGDFPTGTMLLISLRGNDDTRYETTKVSTQ